MPPRTKSPGPVPKKALAYFDAKEITPGFDYRDVWRTEHNVAFTVAKVMERDILTDVRDMTRDAIEKGISLNDFKETLSVLLDKSGWSSYVTPDQRPHRLRTIYDTNMRTARAAGQWQRIQRRKKHLPYLLYELGASTRHREVHVGWDGTILPIDDSFWSFAMPPNGYG